MANLPITHMTLYKHGVGYYVRRNLIDGESVKLTFRREEMDDLLKNLTVLDHGGGQIRGVDYDTPQSQAEKLAGSSIILDDKRSVRDLVLALRGRAVALAVGDGSRVEGTLLRLDGSNEMPQQRSLVSILRLGTEQVTVLPIGRIEAIELQDETAAGDLRFFLQTALGQETHRSITIRLSPVPRRRRRPATRSICQAVGAEPEPIGRDRPDYQSNPDRHRAEAGRYRVDDRYVGMSQTE